MGCGPYACPLTRVTGGRPYPHVSPLEARVSIGDVTSDSRRLDVSPGVHGCDAAQSALTLAVRPTTLVGWLSWITSSLPLPISMLPSRGGLMPVCR